MFGTRALDLAGLIVMAQLHAHRTRTHVTLSRNNGTVVTAAAIVHCTQVTELLVRAVGTIVGAVT